MKVCFFLDNSRISDVNLSSPERGNPGIGGTEFMIWTIGYYLNKLYEEVEVFFLAPNIKLLPQGIKSIQCMNMLDSVRIVKELDNAVLVLRGGKYLKKDLYELIDNLQVKTIMWCHNFENYEYLKLASACKYIIRNICVSKEQYDRLRDHQIFTKSDYIYNALDFNLYNKNSFSEKENIVCYIGDLRPLKGFHKLAQIWPEIERRVPNAKLYVIGSGQLYDRSEKLGDYGIATKEYEAQFIKYITDDSGEVKKNIHFFGNLAHDEKINVISQSKVGVVNPIAKDETFCISAVEFQALGVPVVSKKNYGLLNTVKNGETGILINNDEQLIKTIVKLLEDNQFSRNLGKNGVTYVDENFNIFDICSRWKEVLQEVEINDKIQKRYSLENYNENFKWLRECNRIFKKIFKRLPALCDYPECIFHNPYYRKLSTLKNKLRQLVK